MPDKTIWEQIADRLNSILNKKSLFDEFAMPELGEVDAVDIPKRAAGNYKESDIVALFKEFRIDVMNQYNATFPDELVNNAKLTGYGKTSDVIFDVFKELLISQGEEDVENERDITSDAYRNLNPLQKIAWTRLTNLEIESKAFPTHVLRGEKVSAVLHEMKQAGLINTVDIDLLPLSFIQDLNSKLQLITNAAGESPSGGYRRSIGRLVGKIKDDDIITGDSIFPTVKNASQVFLENKLKNIALDLINAGNQKEFNEGIDLFIATIGYDVPSTKPESMTEEAYKKVIDKRKIDLFGSLTTDIGQGEDPIDVANGILQSLQDFLNSENLETAQLQMQESLFRTLGMTESDAKKELNAQLFRLGFNSKSFLSEDYDDLLQQMRNFPNSEKFGEYIGLQIPSLLTRKTNDSLIKDSSLLRSQLLDVIKPETESYRRYLINNVLTDDFVRSFQESLNTRKSVSLEKLYHEKLRDFTDNPNDSDFGSLITPLSVDDFDEQKVIARIGTLQQQINLGYDPDTNTWDTRAGLLPKSPLSALEVGPMVSDEEIISAYEELAGEDERFYRYLQGLTPDLKNQFATEYKAARFDEPSLTQAERDMYDRYNQLGFKEEDLVGTDLDVYKSLRNKLSQTYGSRATNIFNQLNPSPKQVDSEVARQQIEAVGIPTPDPVKILQGLESDGIALTEGQKKVLLQSGTPGVTVTQGSRAAEDISAYATQPNLTFKDFLKGKRSDLQRQLTLDYGRTPTPKVSGGSRTFSTRITRGRT